MTDIETIDKAHWLPEGEPIITTQRKDIKASLGERGGVQYRSTLEPMAFYLSKHMITVKQHRAGKRLFGLWRSSAFGEQYVTMRFTDDPGMGNAIDRRLVARDYFDACKAISNEFKRHTVLRVVCNGEFSGRGHKFQALLSGLDDLVRHFKY